MGWKQKSIYGDGWDVEEFSTTDVYFFLMKKVEKLFLESKGYWESKELGK